MHSIMGDAQDGGEDIDDDMDYGPGKKGKGTKKPRQPKEPKQPKVPKQPNARKQPKETSGKKGKSKKVFKSAPFVEDEDMDDLPHSPPQIPSNDVTSSENRQEPMPADIDDAGDLSMGLSSAISGGYTFCSSLSPQFSMRWQSSPLETLR